MKLKLTNVNFSIYGIIILIWFALLGFCGIFSIVASLDYSREPLLFISIEALLVLIVSTLSALVFLLVWYHLVKVILIYRINRKNETGFTE